ncbi:MAG: tRNA pseudouridine(55) synthase TruB [Clostridiales bacterium]|nr:tRNA pseudouridine(55) synthase TruB [Clostridiales bacterium]
MNGFIILDKPEGITSFIAAGIVKRAAGVKKAGHTGTLDPMATGVLPVAVGHATRFIDFLPDCDKAYRASFRLGETTDTLDITGKTLTVSDNIPNENYVTSLFPKFTGEILQLPPMYSAIRIDGRRLYDLARRGIDVEREKRKVAIYYIEYISHEGNEYTIEVKCSKGTYIRSLISDIGECAGCGAVMTSLKRILSNGFSLEDAHSGQEIKNAANSGLLEDFLIPVDAALKAYPEVYVSQGQAKRFSNGGGLSGGRLHMNLEGSLYRVYSDGGKFLGLGEYDPDLSELKVKRVFVE